MTRIHLIPREGTFYKANLHCHSTCSDGGLTPEQLKDVYKAAGYQILAYTDHNILNDFRGLGDPDFLVLCGYETDFYTPDCGKGYPKSWHCNAIARDPDKAVYIDRPETPGPESMNAVIQKMIDAGCLVTCNHPGWSGAEPEDVLPLRGCTAVEVYNHLCEVLAGEGNSVLLYNTMLKSGMKIYAVATDDCHNFNLRPGNESWPADNGGGWTMFKMPELTYPEAIRAFETGAFYCSTGPEIYDFYIEDGFLCVDCSPACAILLKSRKINCSAQILSRSGDLTHAAFDLQGERMKDEPFLRIEIVDAQRRTAYTNPYFQTTAGR